MAGLGFPEPQKRPNGRSLGGGRWWLSSCQGPQLEVPSRWELALVSLPPVVGWEGPADEHHQPAHTGAPAAYQALFCAPWVLHWALSSGAAVPAEAFKRNAFVPTGPDTVLSALLLRAQSLEQPYDGYPGSVDGETKAVLVTGL